MDVNKITRTLKVITIDNSPVVNTRVQFMLNDTPGIQLLGNAWSISTALPLIHKQKPDIVILDIHLEENNLKVNGINLLVTLREKYPELKIIVLTNLTEVQYRSACMSLGANYFFDKSNDFDKMLQTLTSIASTQNSLS